MSDRLEAEIERVTSDSNFGEDPDGMLNIIERVANRSIESNQFLRLLSKRIRTGIKSPFILIQSLSLVNYAVKNCDEAVKLKISGHEFIDTLRLIGEEAPHTVVSRLTCFLKNWILSEDFAGKQHSHIMSLYVELSTRGFGKADEYEQFIGATASEREMALREKEDKDLAEAIAESLKLNSAQQEQSPNGFHPGEMVRALYDFEALEVEELSFAAGDIITLITCKADEGWWKGSIGNKSGVFPATFVTRIDEVKDDSAVLVDSSQVPVATVTIDESKIDDCLVFIHGLDPVHVSEDEKTRQDMEDSCYRMGPLIDAELNHIDHLLDECNAAYSKLVTSLQSYHLVNEQQISKTADINNTDHGTKIPQTLNTTSANLDMTSRFPTAPSIPPTGQYALAETPVIQQMAPSAGVHSGFYSNVVQNMAPPTGQYMSTSSAPYINNQTPALVTMASNTTDSMMSSGIPSRPAFPQTSHPYQWSGGHEL